MVSFVIRFAILVTPTGIDATAVKVIVAFANPFAGTFARVTVHTLPAVAPATQSVVAPVMLPEKVVLVGTTSKNVWLATAVPPALEASKS